MILSASEPFRHATGRHAWGHDPEVAHYALGGVPVSVTDMAGLVDTMRRRLRRGPGTPVRADQQGGVVGRPAGPRRRPIQASGHATIDQVPGIESVETVCRAGLAEGWRHFFLGGGPGVAEALAHEMARRAPGLAIAGHETLPYRPLTEPESQALHQRIRGAGTQVLWIGLSTPKQELFMHRHAAFLPGTIAMGVGAAFDVNLNTIPRAPAAMTRLGLEWLYRLIREPRRLGRRYATVVPRFLAIVARDRGTAGKP